MADVAQGDRVKLREGVARSVMRGLSLDHSRRNRVDWLVRRGTIVHVSHRGDAMVQWDDRKTKDPWPLSALEVAA